MRRERDIFAEHRLSRREQQIMDAVIDLGKGTAMEIIEKIPDAPTLDAIRRLIRILEEKGYLRHEKSGRQYVYYSTVEPGDVRISALDHVIQTYFRGSVSKAMAALFDSSEDNITDDELKNIQRLLDRAKKEGR